MQLFKIFCITIAQLRNFFPLDGSPLRNMNNQMTSQLDTLTQINLDDLVSSFGWQKLPLLAAILRGTLCKAGAQVRRTDGRI